MSGALTRLGAVRHAVRNRLRHRRGPATGTTTLTGVGTVERAQTTAPPRSLRSRSAWVALTALALVPLAPAPSAEAAAPANFSYSGSAFGTSVFVGSTYRSGPSAYLVLGCTSNGNLHKTNSTTALNLPSVGRTGAVSTTADTYPSPVRARTSASTASPNLLGGRVQASTIKAASHTSRSGTGYTLSSSGTTLSGLVVNGRPVSASTAPNTRISLPGFGYVIVNEQIRRTNGLTVNGLHVVVNTQNSLGVAVGTNVIVSQAVSALTGPVVGVVNGYAYGTKASAGTTVTSDSSFPSYVPCLGSRGVFRVNTGSGINVDGLTSDTITNSARGTVNTTIANAETIATVQTVDLLDGLVTATAVKARARAATTGTTRTFSAIGSEFTDLRVAGRPDIDDDVAQNTTVELPGVGTLYLRRVSLNGASVTVQMIELRVTSPTNGVPAGTTLRVAVAGAGLS